MVDTELRAFDQIHSAAQSLRDQVGRAVIGQRRVIDLLTAATLVQGHTLLVGAPGLAKTRLVRSLAASLGWQFRRVQFTPDMMPSDVIGTELVEEGDGGKRALRFVEGPVFTNLLLADEINRTPPRTQAALLEAMAEHQVTAGGATRPLPEPFVVIATQNPIEQEGTYPLPEAQLDRFMFSLNVDYPDPADEARIIAEVDPDSAASIDLQPVFDAASAGQAAELIRRMPLAESVRDYVLKLVRATRPRDATCPESVARLVAWGAGPRAGQYLVLAAKALAAIAGEPTPSTTHVRDAAEAVLSHRLIVNYTAAGEGLGTGDVLRLLFDHVGEQ